MNRFLSASYATTEEAARAYARAAGVRLDNATASSLRLRERGTLIADGPAWKLTAAPSKRGARKS